MNPQPEQDSERRLQQLEADVVTPPPQPPIVSQPQKPLQPQLDNSQLQVQFNKFITWFNGLPGFGKLIIVGVAIIVGLAIARALLKLVFAVISLGFLAVLLYFGYQFFIRRSSENKQ